MSRPSANYLVTPRDWQAIAQREAAELLGTAEGAAKLAEARRYGALADELSRLHSAYKLLERLRQLELDDYWKSEIDAVLNSR